MTPHMQIPSNPEHLNNLPWYMLLLGAVVAKVESVSYKVLFTLAIALIGAMLGIGIKAMSDRFDATDRSFLLARQELKDEIKGVSAKLDAQNSANIKHELAIIDLCGKLENHIQNEKKGKP